MHVNSLESVFRPIPRNGCANNRFYRRNNWVSVHEEVRIKILAVERRVATGYVAVVNIRGRVLYLDREGPNKQCVVPRCLNNRDRIG